VEGGGIPAPLSGYYQAMPDDVTRRHLPTTALVGALLPADVPEGQTVRAWAGTGTVTIRAGSVKDGEECQKALRAI
jgi:hypothetical protein